MVDRFQRFTFSMFEISRCWHKLASEVMAEYDMKGPYAIYLVELMQNPQGLTAAQLCELSARDKADVSRAVSIMEEKGLIEREKGNSYRAKIFLTNSGLEAAEYICSRAAKAVELAGKDISDQDRIVFYQALSSITENLRTLGQQGLPE